MRKQAQSTSQPASPIDLSAADPMAVPLADIDVSQPKLFKTETLWPYFARLRKEAPVHKTVSPLFGPFWSITRFSDIMAVDKNHAVFSSDGNITLNEKVQGLESFTNFISMDQNGPNNGLTVLCTGASFRRRAKYGQSVSVLKSFG